MANYSPLEQIEILQKEIKRLRRSIPAGVVVDGTPTDGSNNAVSSNAMFDALASKADGSTVNAALALKADTSTVNSALALKADASTTTSALALKADASTTTSALALKATTASLSAHTSDVANPHAVTKTQVGLANVDNTSDVNKPVSTAQQTAIDAYRVGRTAIVANTGSITTGETIVTQLAIPLNTLVVGSTYRLTASGTCTSSAANISTIRLRLGTAGTTSDAVMSTITATAATTGTNVPFSVTLYITIRTTGSGGTVAGNGFLINTGSTGILATDTSVAALSTAAAVNTTVANTLSFSHVTSVNTTSAIYHLAFIELVK